MTNNFITIDIDAKYRGLTSGIFSGKKEKYDFKIVNFNQGRKIYLVCVKNTDKDKFNIPKKLQLLEWDGKTTKEKITNDIMEKTGIDLALFAA